MKHTLTTIQLRSVDFPKVYVYWYSHNMMQGNCSVWNNGAETVVINSTHIFEDDHGYPHILGVIELHLLPNSSRSVSFGMDPLDNLKYVEYINERKSKRSL